MLVVLFLLLLYEMVARLFVLIFYSNTSLPLEFCFIPLCCCSCKDTLLGSAHKCVADRLKHLHGVQLNEDIKSKGLIVSCR